MYMSVFIFPAAHPYKKKSWVPPLLQSPLYIYGFSALSGNENTIPQIIRFTTTSYKHSTDNATSQLPHTIQSSKSFERYFSVNIFVNFQTLLIYPKIVPIGGQTKWQGTTISSLNLWIFCTFGQWKYNPAISFFNNKLQTLNKQTTQLPHTIQSSKSGYILK